MVHLLCQVLKSLGVGDILTILALVILAIEDIKFGEIHYRYLLLMVDFLYLEGYIFLVTTIIFYRYVKKYIGGADLLIFGFIITRYGLYNLSYILFYAALLGLVYALIFKVKTLRFIPFILMGFIIFILGGI